MPNCCCSGLRPRSYRLIEEAIEAGVRRGWDRAHKHVANPDPNVIRESIESEVMTEICERFDFVEHED